MAEVVADIVILTTRKHCDGIWITLLVQKLSDLRPDLSVRVVEVDSVHGSLFPVTRPSWKLIINRVADSSDPVCFKVCTALLAMSRLWHIPVLNGIGAYAVGANKVMHHQILSKAGLRTPRSVVIHAQMANFEQQAVTAAQSLLKDGCQWPLLLKPNAGGFGNGIHLFWDLPTLHTFCSSSERLALRDDDHVLLLQEYIVPRDQHIFRVWFLGQKVQCAVRLTRPALAPAPTTLEGAVKRSLEADFTGGCAGGECKRQKTHHASTPGTAPVQTSSAATPLGDEREFVAWRVPDSVRADVERITKIVGPDCHCGSVEFLYDSGGEAVYFDLNMVSTLPRNIPDPDGVWGEKFDPWHDLAEFGLTLLPASPE